MTEASIQIHSIEQFQRNKKNSDSPVVTRRKTKYDVNDIKRTYIRLRSFLLSYPAFAWISILIFISASITTGVLVVRFSISSHESMDSFKEVKSLISVSFHF